MTLATSCATPIFRGQQLTPPSSSSSDVDEPSLTDAGHWKAVARDLKCELRSTRLDALVKIHQLIHELTLSDGSLSERDLDDVHRTGYALREASQDGTDMDELEQEFTRFASKTLGLLETSRNGGDSDKAPLNSSYGGAVGNIICKTITSEVVVPLLRSFVRTFSEQTRHLVTYNDRRSAAKEFLHTLFKLAGKERGRIAEMTATEDFENFGRLFKESDDRLQDFVGSCARWKPWETMVINKIREVISPAWAEFRASHGESPDPLLFLPSQDQVELFLQKENLSLRLEKTEDGWKGSLFDNIKQDKRARFEFLFSPQEDPNEALSNPIAVHDIRCIHTKRFPFAEAQLADDFLAVTDSIEDAQELQDTLASIFHRLSQSSTYRRGGAWFAEVMIFVLALDQGYALEFSPAWTPPDHPQPDQVALLELDREKFILAARDNLLMRSVS